MNPLDSTIQSARKKRFIQYVVIGGILFFSLLVYVTWLFLAKGYVLQVMPEEAQKSAFASVKKGQGIYLAGVLYRLSEQVTVEVGAEDFETQTLTINAASESTIPVTLIPSPATLMGRTQPSDPNTTWHINGKLVHKGETLEYKLPPGDHQVLINNKFYAVIQDTVTVQRNQSIEKEWTLKTITGQLQIDTQPSNANVMIDAESLGTSPLVFERPAGRYRIQVSAEGYQAITEEVEIHNDALDIQRNYRLLPKQGFLSLSLSPTEGELMLDGVIIKNVESNDRATLSINANQRYTLRYNKAGYLAYSTNIIVSPEETKAITIALKPEFGKVNINTSPTASIVLNGKAVGRGAYTAQLPAVRQQLEFILAGYRTQALTITPSSQAPKNINIKLLTEFEARRKEGKPLFVSTLGIALLPIKPERFVMGSPANEVGRKRNEFQIEVDFTRGIWVSRHEITEAQYAAFDSSKAKSALPVSDISWLDAVNYCNWLSEREGLPVFYTITNGRVASINKQSPGYRLLTEAEWEWLAKKAKRSTPTVYVWGDSDRLPKEAGNFADKTLSASATFYLKDYSDGFAGKAPVGSFAADRVGLYDLAGNVSEWVHDTYTNTPPSLTGVLQDYMGATKGVGNIYKGANYTSGRLADLRGAFRETEKGRAPTIGFRIARYQ
jgi:formylglycine-generating enzyme required for sulfatase activity